MTARFKFALALTTALVGATGAQAQQGYYSRSFSFGDSLSDTGRVLRETGYNAPRALAPGLGGPGIYSPTAGIWSNEPNFLQVLPGLVGVPYNPANNFAVGGAISGNQPANAGTSPFFPYGFPNQVDQFIARGGSFTSHDVINVWFGYNDISGIPANGTPAQIASGINTIYNNVSGNINRLVALGGQNFVVFNTQTFRSLFPASVAGANSPIAAQFNQGFVNALQPLSDRGLNIHFFDLATLSDRFRSNPTAYGFAANAGTVSCAQDPACSASGSTTGLENQYISPENIHFTGKANTIIAAYLANQINAPLTIAPQGELGQAAGLAFSSTLIDFLSAERRRNMAMSVPATFTADLPGRAAPPVTIPVQVGSPLSAFALGTYVNVDRTAQNRAGGGSTGNTYNADFGGVTAGLLYQATPNLVLGAAFNYLNTSVDLRGLTNGRIDMDSFQGSGFASLSFSNFFADVVGTYGRNNYSLDRPGVMNDRLTASPSGDAFTVAARTGYLFDFGTFKAGPVGEVAYANVSVDAYRERGDTLLTIGTRRQSLEGLTAGGGIQIRTTVPMFAGLVSPFLNVTAQHDFLDGVRTVTSFQTYAPTLLIRTQAGRRADDVYGRVAGGLDLDFGNGLSGVLTGSTSFARSGGDDHTVSVGLRYRF
ncbi:phospholipase/lecithinase/hemolysin/uncharacterized protein YhjY with autotransporter beta-barrel domain [Methylobacterium brachiatum]|uniref:Phospholipase/lecithinase/hemolysin/uncharacterized protein YhjY with autotransporter beta-barrel domain n=1 Tax=Methylobacterium brachiatum TaxID=269660 RepID=A0AAJ1U3Q7_9HYPH|nr:autotransporter domain-containing protein [Methylobacterium brachiatum]MCB4806584.1 autotransporter domain-containing protein [Methylobacterium brachiatum]MDQ0547503.1 phospholipase/lecithinase/hemolysin/uncharacterized protein YhjY with autotransporter beta-barrel domain [Methylobacterium brachiatum]